LLPTGEAVDDQKTKETSNILLKVSGEKGEGKARRVRQPRPPTRKREELSLYGSGIK